MNTETLKRKHITNDGEEVISTGQLSAIFGISVSVARILELNAVTPYMTSTLGTYWRRRDVPLIAIELAKGLLTTAQTQQIIMNIEAEHGR